MHVIAKVSTALIAVLLIPAVLLMACAAPAPQYKERAIIYGSFFPIYSLVSEIAGPDADVRSFMPYNQDPHLWEPSPKDIRALAEADLLVVNGANMEPWLPQVEEALPSLPILNLSEYVELINYKGAAALGEFQYIGRMHIPAGADITMAFGHTHERELRAAFFKDPGNLSINELVQRGRDTMNDEGQPLAQHEHTEVVDSAVHTIKMGHESGDVTFVFPEGGDWIFVSDRESEEILPYWFTDKAGATIDTEPIIEGGSAKTEHSIFDPHSWLSLVNAKRYANAIGGQLRQMMPEHDEALDKRTRTLVATLTQLQAQFKAQLKQAQHKEFLTSHNAFAYVARDYGLTQHPLQGLTTHEAPKLRVLTEAIRVARRSGITVVFYELGSDPKTAEVIADEIGGVALPLCSMEYGPIDSGRQTYTDIVQFNLENLATALAVERTPQ
ncbi:metal ABC transporter substrate-binding protein [Corynebacterium belfantii]|uniref:Zinc ABC transporter substrate-binding protein n=1 Tax=Corynebacterium belfantii TaxID=2014537 RepID=A0ABS0LAL6_9CORY|nr:metal ABC transporter substrate-binding protein [Corynebacterium belfantii]MBG9346657.1 zinc ABC transporter substrate-binding protein [Corynebacterium belfantii]MBG9353692.1 zinc ABC transporter substrate-binding protein [Corynebacterium belfantii]